MACMGFPGDCDPRDDEPENWCVCGDLLDKDLLGDWFCPSCTKEEAEKQTQE
jgi:hypothetical protein